MLVDLSLLESGVVDNISITNNYTFTKDYYENTDILELKDVKADGYVYKDVSEDDHKTLVDYIKCTISGTMLIEDSISLEPVEYPFFTEYDDILEQNCKKNENTLDIFQFLWENIVLEVPLQFTKVEDLSKFHGDGWKLIREEDLTSSSNPFSDLLKDFEEE